MVKEMLAKVKKQFKLEYKNKTAGPFNSYYLFTKVNNDTVSWYALCKYRYHHFFWFLIKFMPAEYVMRKTEQGIMAP